MKARKQRPKLLSYADEDMKEALHYTQCGLDDVYLLNGYEVEEIGGEEYLTVKNLDGLHVAIGLHLITRRKLLGGREIRFLRRQMDLTQSELARLFGCDAQQIARYEKGENKIPGPADRLLRAIYREHVCSNQSILDLLRTLDELDARRNDKQVFESTASGWQTAA